MLAMAGCVPAQKIGRRKYAPLARQRGATSTKKNRQARWYALAPHAGGICDGRLSRQSSRKIRDVTKLRPLKIFNATKCHETFAIHNAANSCNINKFRSRGLLQATNMSRKFSPCGLCPHMAGPFDLGHLPLEISGFRICDFCVAEKSLKDFEQL